MGKSRPGGPLQRKGTGVARCTDVLLYNNTIQYNTINTSCMYICSIVVQYVLLAKHSVVFCAYVHYTQV